MRPVAVRIAFGEYFKLKDLCKELRTSTSDILRSALYREMERLKNLSVEEKIEEINDNVEWNHSKYLMSNNSK